MIEEIEGKKMKFNDKTAVITGGANGIGLCIATEFAKLGAKVAIVDIDKDAGEKVLRRISDNGGKGLFYCGDIAEKAVLEGFSEKVIREYGKIDYLINNACISRKGIISGCDFDAFNYVLKVGVTAPYMLTKLFMPHFHTGGAVVNISSTRAMMSQSDTESYTSAKGGISALSNSLAVSLAGWIDVTANFDENYDQKHSQADKVQHPSKRVGNPLDIARAVLLLCAENNNFIQGQNITVDGGMTKQMIYSGDNGWTYDCFSK